ncbi:Rpn family recombination-promoting nuclease/putative transposase [Aneurinibacillus sp. Ricciae_BoGa-3]|uniref:Rpn family recombination-promoting nuclease/putative transposase n=1 Tax=Aneurinibacillus sp. Ricciae_BoGa-3 TaxID=3022697 RepID=UPI0023408D3A|nr:Rpn family recombination-promoting nuclease/putative transposase [Aneurinibacillus sp. Ricciae_BoGa-3]WCK54308.1 Rpn family recombination-promoting nuclease/putative transposase [Aneurinibacillus sp. Ricciae_BoGa-3]
MKLYVDFAFKKLFGSRGNERILIAFLNAMIKPPPDKRIMGITLLDKEMGREYQDDKNAILDIHAQLDDGSKVNVKIQLANEHNLPKRTLYYWSRMYIEDIQKNENNNTLPRTICIIITGFSLFNETEERYHLIFDVKERQEGFRWDDTLEIHLVELPKLVKLWREKRIGFGDDELVEWLLLLEAGDNEGIRKELEVRAMDNPALHEAMEKWENLSRDPDARREYEARHKAMMDRLSIIAENERRQQEYDRIKQEYARKTQEMYEEGFHEGRIEEKRAMARTLLAKGLDEKMLAEVTKLTLEQIQQLHRG